MIKAVICDWSGTLSNDKQPVFRANELLYKSYGKKSPPFEQFFKETKKTLVQFARENGIMASPDELHSRYANFYNQVVENGIAKAIMYDDTIPFLQHLQTLGRKRAVLSAHPQSALNEEAIRYGIASFFEIIQGDARNKAIGLNKILTSLQIPPREAIYLGDTIGDIQFAREVGIPSIAVSRGYHEMKDLVLERPDLGVFDDLSAIVNSRILENGSSPSSQS